MKFTPLASLLSAILLFPFGNLAAQTDPADLVNPMIGTAGEGQTFPTAGVPFSMTDWTPQTRAGEIKCVAPYYAADTRLQGFRGSHFLSGSCTQDYGSVTLMPLTSVAKFDPVGRSSSFQRNSEIAHPYLYEVNLTQSHIHAAITASEQVCCAFDSPRVRLNGSRLKTTPGPAAGLRESILTGRRSPAPISSTGCMLGRGKVEAFRVIS